MASSDKPDPESVKTEAAPPPPPPSKCRTSSFSVDIGLRVLLFAATLSAVIVMVTSKQTKLIPVPGIPVPVPLSAKFNHSPAFIYFVAALSVACLYSIISTLASISLVLKPSYATKFLLYLAFWDVLMLGIVAAATGASGGVAYIGLKGNSHVRWNKICNTYGEFCRHVGSSVALSLLASVVLVFLIMSSVCSLHRRARDCNK